MDRQELNKRMAEWAGWSYKDNLCFPPGVEQTPWNAISYGGLPNFTQSLDACFEWLVPKLGKFQRGLVIERWAIRIILDDKIEPALALYLTIEKLIDEETA